MKKIVSILAGLALFSSFVTMSFAAESETSRSDLTRPAVSTTTTTTAQPVDETATVPYLVGDYNGDKWVDKIDYTALEEKIASWNGVIPAVASMPSMLHNALNDINQDGLFDEGDLAFLKQMMNGVEALRVLEWNQRTQNVVSYSTLTPASVDYSLYIIGDINRNFDVDFNDYELLRDYVSGYATDLTPLEKVFYDVDGNGEIDSYDVYELLYALRNKTYITTYFWDNKNDQVTAYSTIDKYTQQIGIVGDLNKDTFVNNLDYEILQEVLVVDTADWRPLEKLYVRDVNRDGKVNTDDLDTLAAVSRGDLPVEAFYWDAENEKPSEYFIFQEERDPSTAYNFFLVGDINTDGIIDILDLDLLVSWLNGELEDALTNLQYTLMDVNIDGHIDPGEDLALLENIINGKADIYALYWSYTFELPENIFIYKRVSNEYYIVGDLNEDGYVTSDDYDGLQRIVSATEKILIGYPPVIDCIRDVNMDGFVNDEDVAAIKLVIDGYSPVFAFYWDIANNRPIEYFVYQAAKNQEFYIVGDINSDKAVDSLDYDWLNSWLKGEGSDALSYLQATLMDVNMDGNVGMSDDLYALQAVIEGYAPVYAFYWDSVNEKPEYFVYEQAKKDLFNVVGDINYDNYVSYDDYVFIKSICEKYDGKIVSGWLYTTFDVNMNGVIDKGDLSATEEIIRGKAPVYGFYWDDLNDKLREYVVYSEASEFYCYNTIGAEDVKVTATDEEISNNSIQINVPIYPNTSMEAYGFTAYVTVSKGEIFDLAIEEESYFTINEELTSVSKISDNKYKVMVTFNETLPVTAIMSSTSPNIANLVITAPVLQNSQITLDLESGLSLFISDEILIDSFTETATATIKISQPASSVTLYGDLNNDNALSLSDLIMLYQYIGGKRSLSNYQLSAADINRNNLIDATDLAIFKRIFLSA